MNRSYQRVEGCYCVSARARDSGGLELKGEVSQRKEAERLGQSERANREGHGIRARAVKTFRELAIDKKDVADLWTKSDLRVKRRDPWLQANALPKAVGDLEQSGQDAA